MSATEVPSTDVSTTPCVVHDWVQDGNGGWMCTKCPARSSV